MLPKSVTPPLTRLDRNFVAPHQGSGSIAPKGAITPNSVLKPASSQSNFSVHTNVNWWWSNPANRFNCFTSLSGCQYGYFYCGPSLYWYWWRPGCSPCFRPYSYYYWPSCYYYPAYYPSYSTVTYVHDYYDDTSYFPSYTEAPAEYAEAPAVGSEVAPSGLDATALLASGWTEFTAGAYLEAAESFRQAVLADPNDAQAKAAFAQALFAMGNYPDAAFMIRRTVELLPDWPVTGVDPRARYADPNDHAEQMIGLRTFLEHVRGDPAALLVLAVQSYFTGDLAAARESFTTLAALDPEDLVAKRFLERLGPAPAPIAPPGAPAPASDR